MSESLSPIDEIRKLVDLLVDGKITPAGYSRIEELLLTDNRCLQTYVERLDFHTVLVDQADFKTPEESVLEGMHRFMDAPARKRESNNFPIKFALISCFVIALGMGSLAYYLSIEPIPIGEISALSADVNARRPYELGEILRKGEVIAIKEGQALINVEGVMLDLVGPVSVRMDGTDIVTLLNGTIVANVPPSRIGFTVRTRDAEIMDLGTEFAVSYQSGEGTEVSVQKGEIRATLLNRSGTASRVVDVTTLRTVNLNSLQSTLSEISFRPRIFQEITKSRGTVRSTSGNLRIQADPPSLLTAGGLTTSNFALMISEKQNVTLSEDLTLETAQGRKTIPAGAVISSYLVHYDPTNAATMAPRGAVSFSVPVAALITSAEWLRKTDAIFGLPHSQYDSSSFGGLELSEDEVVISDDRQTVSFYFGMEPPMYLDQMRILIQN